MWKTCEKRDVQYSWKKILRSSFYDFFNIVYFRTKDWFVFLFFLSSAFTVISSYINMYDSLYAIHTMLGRLQSSNFHLFFLILFLVKIRY